MVEEIVVEEMLKVEHLLFNTRVNLKQISICSFFAQKIMALDGWMDGWVDGWMGG